MLICVLQRFRQATWFACPPRCVITNPEKAQPEYRCRVLQNHSVDMRFSSFLARRGLFPSGPGFLQLSHLLSTDGWQAAQCTHTLALFNTSSKRKKLFHAASMFWDVFGALVSSSLATHWCISASLSMLLIPWQNRTLFCATLEFPIVELSAGSL